MTTDAEFLGLEVDGDRSWFTLVERLARMDGKLYGGAAIAASMASAEARTGHPVTWMTTQFVSTVGMGSVIALTTDVLAAGRRTQQVRVTGTSEAGDVVFASLGATGEQRPDALSGTFERAPTVTSPTDSAAWVNPFSGLVRAAGLRPEGVPLRRTGFASAVDMRQPDVLAHPDPGPGRLCLWVRRADGATLTPALTAYLADMVPMAVAHALGVVAGGVSLDNTIRVGAFTDTEWLLVDLRPHLAAGGYGHGIANLWSEDGHLLATASQSSIMRPFDPTQIPGLAAADGS